MDALKNLSANIPDWLRRLEELSSQIEQRQIELAKFAEANSPSPNGDSRSLHSMKSLRNKGSTESLRPADEPADRHLTPEEDGGAGITPTPSPGPAAYDVTPTPTPAPGAVKSAAPGPEATAAAETQMQATPSSPTPAEPPTTPTATATATAAPSSPRPLANGTPSQQKQASDTELMEATRARARALVRKRIRSDSLISADGAAVAYRSKNMVLVYYDSYVQSFFEELVKFVSGSRNLMRKAKMAAKVAHIRRMAELEVNGYSDDNDDNQDGEAKADDGGPILAADPAPLLVATEPAAQKREGDGDGDEEELPPLKYISTRQMYVKSRLGPGGAAMLRPSFARASARGSYGGSGGISSAAAAGGSGASMMSGGPVATAFDTLDKGLEFVQSTSERAAHQFLRDGDCEEEMAKIKSRLAETRELAATELERKLKEGPSAEDLALEEAAAKSRSYRLPSMRRESVKKTAPAPAVPSAPLPAVAPSTVPTPPWSPPPADEAKTAAPSPPTLVPSPVAPLDKTGKLEVDDSIDDDDYEVMPKLVYKSTRRMMRGGIY